MEKDNNKVLNGYEASLLIIYLCIDLPIDYQALYSIMTPQKPAIAQAL
jgi:hypothetical protein